MTKGDVVLLVGRDNWEKDELLNVLLLDYLKTNNVRIIWEDPVAEFSYRSGRIRKLFSWMPVPTGYFALRLSQILAGLLHPSYFIRLYKRRKDRSIAFRCSELREIVHGIRDSSRITVLSRSSGGRVASLVADELNLKCVICLGYPFKHPNERDEPDRYRHLATIKTATLIFQGTRDVYGGVEVVDKYVFSGNVVICFVDTDHEFGIDDKLASDIFKKVKNFSGFSGKQL